MAKVQFRLIAVAWFRSADDCGHRYQSFKQAGLKAPDGKLILEVNPEHALVQRLVGSTHFHGPAQILFDQALLAEGGLPEDKEAYVKRVNALLV